MNVSRLVILALLAACDRAQGVPDEELGALVIAPKDTDVKIDVAKAATDRAELSKALMRPHRAAVAAFGPSTVSITMTTILESEGKPVENLGEKTLLELGDGTAWHGVYESTADYGREAIFDGKNFFLRPRYQRWHERLPEAPDEPTTMRDGFVEAIGATWDLFAPGAELTDKGATTVAGRPGRSIAIARAAKAADNPREAVTQRKWREGRTVEAIEGSIVLDAASGAPLAVKLSGAIRFAREGKPLVMKVTIDAAVDKIGVKAAIAPPAMTDVVATPERQREVDDQDFLLNGIAPPIRKNPDGTPVPPNPHFAGSGSAGDVKLPPPGAGSAPPPEEPKKKRRHRDDDDEKSEKSDSSKSEKSTKDSKDSDSKSEKSEKSEKSTKDSNAETKSDENKPDENKPDAP